MALKNQYTTADYIEWDVAMNLIRRLYRDGQFRMSLLIGCGCMFGLRYSDLSRLTWYNLLSDDKLIVYEQKTGKRREIRINKAFQRHINDCYKALAIVDPQELCFVGKSKTALSIQAVNRNFKVIKERYLLRINNFSTHSLRKTFGRRVVDMAGADAEMALIKLSELFNHASPMVTRRYLGLRREELGEVYQMLRF